MGYGGGIARGGRGYRSIAGGGTITPIEVTNNPYASAGVNAYIVQVHTHTNGSDGVLTPAQLVTYYEGKGYHVLAITDHDVVTVQPASTMTAITGNELTLSTAHIGSMFTDYTRGSETNIQTIINAVNTNGGLSVINHPLWNNLLPIGTIDNYNNYLGIEMFNAVCESDEHDKTGFAVDVWDHILTNISQVKWGFASDDYHSSNTYRTGNIGRLIVFAASASLADIKTAIQNGAFVSDVGATNVDIQKPTIVGTSIVLNCPNARKIRFIGDGGITFKEVVGNHGAYNISDSVLKYIRCEVDGKYEDDFASDSGNWLYPYGTWSISGGILQNTVMRNLPYAVALLAKPVHRDIEVYYEGRFDTENTDPLVTRYIGLEFHAHRNIGVSDGSHALQSGYLFNFYRLGNGEQRARIYENSAGTFTQLIDQITSVLMTTWYSFKVRREGNSIKVKWWIKGETEPDWIFSVSDSKHSHGWVSLISLGVTSSFDNFSIDGIKSYYQPIAL